MDKASNDRYILLISSDVTTNFATKF